MKIIKNMKNIVKDIRISFTNLTDHIGLSFSVAVIDAFSVFTYFTLLGIFFNSIAEEVSTLMNFLIRNAEGASNQELLSIIPSREALNSLIGSMFVNATIFFIVLCLFWTLLQGIAWHLTYRIGEHEKGPKLKNYLKRFGISNIYIGIITYIALLIFVGGMIFPIYVNASVMTINIISLITYIYIISLGFLFVTISSLVYASIFEKKTLKSYKKEIFNKIFSKKIWIFLSITLIAIIALYISDIIQSVFDVLPKETMIIWISAGAIVGFILIFGITLMYRLTTIRTVERLNLQHKKKN